jgi:methylated-DNA-[protein]-cysteine S-methyltransferase
MGPPGHGITSLPAPLGRCWALWTARGLARFHAHGGIGRAREREAWALAAGVDPQGERPWPRELESLLRAFAEGDAVDPTSVPVELEGAPIFVAMWRAARRIPRGEVRSYGELAAMAGKPRAIRAAATAMARCPSAIVVPCHRVIAAGMKLGGYGGRIDRKKALLALEGWTLRGETLARP